MATTESHARKTWNLSKSSPVRGDMLGKREYADEPFGGGFSLFSCASCVFLLLTCVITISAAAAETPGVTENSTLSGSCSALDGPVSFLGRQTVMGAYAYLHMINDEGGVLGRNTLPESRQPSRALKVSWTRAGR